MLWASLTTFGFSAALQTLKKSINAVSIAIMNIPLVGWILALIAVLTAAFTWLWNNVGEFRGFFYGIWNVIKLAFSGIWEVIKIIIDLIVAYFKWWWNNVKTVFNWIVGIVSQAWNWVAAKFQWAWNFIKTKALQIYETLKIVFGGVFNFFKSIFGNIWNIVSKVFDKIWQKIKGIIDFLKPLADAIGKLFNKAGGEFSKGMKQGVKEVADEKRQKAISKKRYDGIMKKEQPSLDFNPAGSVSADNFLGGDKKGKNKKSSGETSAKSSNDGLSMSGEKGGNRTINQTININNYFSAAKQSVGKIADEVTAKINDRLRDGMVALD